MLRALLLAASLTAACATRRTPPARLGAVPEPKVLGVANIQRTMRLLATSSAAQRNRVRLLFYGQSITQSGWSRTVAHELARRFPHADLEIENRAIGGFSSEHLVKAAESDLYSFYPDLVVFHVYGAHEPYEAIIRRLRERTTAEILLQTDHITTSEELDEERDARKLAANRGSYSAFMNYAFLPQLSAKYRAAVCDQRSAWKQYLDARKLEPSALLADDVHLNRGGDALMAALVLRCLHHAPEVGASPLEEAVQTVSVAAASRALQAGTLELAFHGNRIDALLKDGGTTTVRVDGAPPSQHSELYAFSRARVNGAIWPPLYDIGSHAALTAEDFTLHVDSQASEPARYTFELIGSQVGSDGHGDTSRRFVSRSGRVIIDPEDWNIAYAFELAGFRRVPPHFSVTFQVEPHFADHVHGQRAAPGKEQSVTLAQGLTNARHTLELTTAGENPVAAVRIYRPLASRQ